MNRKTTNRLLTASLLFIGLPLFWTLFPPTEPISLADGTYRSDCCGTISLKKGRMTIPHHEVSYVVEYDKVGSYVLPYHLVGVHEGHVFIDFGRGGTFLRLDATRPPQSIILNSDPAESGYEEFRFNRISEQSVR